MIEVFSNNVTASQYSSIPLTTTVIRKGCTATLNGNNINLNKSGIYMVSVGASVSSATVGTLSIEMYKNGQAIPSTISSATIGTANDVVNLGFTALVSVNNCPCCDDDTTINVVNIGNALNVSTINVVVTKVC